MTDYSPFGSLLDLARPLSDNPHLIVHHLHESPRNRERWPVTHAQRTAAEQSHHRRIPGKYPHLTIERRRDHGLRVALEEHRFRRDDRDVKHGSPGQLWNFLAFSTTSSMPPAD